MGEHVPDLWQVQREPRDRCAALIVNRTWRVCAHSRMRMRIIASQVGIARLLCLR